MAEKSMLSAETQRKRIRRLDSAVARLIQSILPLRKEKDRLNRAYDDAWRGRNMRMVNVLSSQLTNALKKLAPHTRRINQLEEKIRGLQKRLTGN